MLNYTCPTCGKTIQVSRREDAPSRPFCSDRCQRVDLAKWFNEEYVISDPISQPTQPSTPDQPGNGAAEA